MPIHYLRRSTIAQQYRSELAQKLSTCTGSEHVDEAWRNVKGAMLEAFSAVCPTFPIRPQHHWMSTRSLSMNDARKSIPAGNDSRCQFADTYLTSQTNRRTKLWKLQPLYGKYTVLAADDDDENDICMLHIDKAFLSYLKTGVQKTNGTPCALNGPKNTFDARRPQFVTIPWRIVTVITTLNDSPKRFMYGAVHGPKYGVTMTVPRLPYPVSWIARSSSYPQYLPDEGVEGTNKTASILASVRFIWQIHDKDSKREVDLYLFIFSAYAPTDCSFGTVKDRFYDTECPVAASQKLRCRVGCRKYEYTRSLPNVSSSDVNSYWDKIDTSLHCAGNFVCGTAPPGALKHWISDQVVALLKPQRNIQAGPEHYLTRKQANLNPNCDDSDGDQAYIMPADTVYRWQRMNEMFRYADLNCRFFMQAAHRDCRLVIISFNMQRSHDLRRSDWQVYAANRHLSAACVLFCLMRCFKSSMEIRDHVRETHEIALTGDDVRVLRDKLRRLDNLFVIFRVSEQHVSSTDVLHAGYGGNECMPCLRPPPHRQFIAVVVIDRSVRLWLYSFGHHYHISNAWAISSPPKMPPVPVVASCGFPISSGLPDYSNRLLGRPEIAHRNTHGSNNSAMFPRVTARFLPTANANMSECEVGAYVFARDYRPRHDPWLQGHLLRKRRSVKYFVSVALGSSRKHKGVLVNRSAKRTSCNIDLDRSTDYQLSVSRKPVCVSICGSKEELIDGPYEPRGPNGSEWNIDTSPQSTTDTAHSGNNALGAECLHLTFFKKGEVLEEKRRSNRIDLLDRHLTLQEGRKDVTSSCHRTAYPFSDRGTLDDRYGAVHKPKHNLDRNPSPNRACSRNYEQMFHPAPPLGRVLSYPMNFRSNLASLIFCHNFGLPLPQVQIRIRCLVRPMHYHHVPIQPICCN
ncbi:hypothetical protein CLF_104713 [Clonorchis sinensis]|uniref:Uncharacterized protein n=1 Tax=Clonorchis sinensis TaxID=79923 RepID=G7YC79_CLOSI|nr:hypothetical protein CLF_104713 [Clonorchis sinensis]